MKREDEMQLPEGKTCADCTYCRKCVSIWGAKETNVRCDFNPSRFTQRLQETDNFPHIRNHIQ